MRRTAAGLAAVFAAGCGGLLFSQGNGFPCDFNAPEDTRDKACAPTEVCSVLNRCERFTYEGPQFEGIPELPVFDAGRKIHPLVLDRPVSLLASNASAREEFLAVLASTDGGGSRAVTVELGRLTLTKDTPFPAAATRQVAVVTDKFGAILTAPPFSAVRLLDGKVVVPSDAVALRAGPRGLGVPPRLAVLRKSGAPIAVDEQGNALEFAPPASDGGLQAVIDLRSIPLSRKGPAPDGRAVVMTREGFFVSQRPFDGGYVSLTPNEDATTFGFPAQEPAEAAPDRIFLRHDLTGALWSFARPFRDQPFPTVLSTWQLTRRGEAPESMARAWNECSPCPNAKILAIAPNLDGLANVEVLCGAIASGEDATLVRVVGSLSADPTDPCVTQPVTSGFDLSNQTLHSESDGRGIVLDDANGGGVVVGGQHGELWHGPSFSRALPLFLERVPLTVGAFFPGADAVPSPLVVTDRYLAAPLFANPPDGGALFNGFKAFDFRVIADFALDDEVRPRALVGGAPGWAVLSSSDVVRVSVRQPDADGGVKGSGNFFALGYGPRLLNARGEPSREPFSGEAVTSPDGGLVSMVLTADDSVYLALAPQEMGAPLSQPPLYPLLTPEPGSPIRSFALERTRLGTDGVKRVRGYAVTSRNLFTVSLSGEPARWNAAPLLLGGGEPLEVWMDNPRGGLGRVGYRDGTVFSLPGGFLLVRPTAGEEPRQVVDYENLGGWPVAYATSGLWVGHYDLVNGKLDNKLADGRPGKPMQWRRVTMADGSTPWMKDANTARPGRLHVLVGPQVQVQPSGAYRQQFRLFLYLADAVYEVGSMRRTNNSAPPNQ